MFPVVALAGDAVYERLGTGGRVTYVNQPRQPGDRVTLPSATPGLGRAIVIVGRAPSVTRRFSAASPPGFSGADAIRRPELDRLITVLSAHYGVDAHLVRAVIEVESGFNPNARSPKGATGLMQLMPATAARYHSGNLYDPIKNIEAGVLYLRDLLVMFGGNPELALAGYNAGEGAVHKYKGRIPPYPETQEYVPKVIAAWRRNRTNPDLQRLVQTVPAVTQVR